MRKALIFGFGALVGGMTLSAQVSQQQLGPQVAGLHEDVRILAQQVGSMALRIEQLERDNARLRSATAGIDTTYATVAQLNAAVADLNRAIRSGDAAAREQSAAAVTELAKQTNAAIDSVARGMAARPAVQTTFTDDFPKQGLSYVIQRGDTLSSIAARFKSTVKDIQNANRITDPTKIQVGQSLFIPGADSE